MHIPSIPNNLVVAESAIPVPLKEDRRTLIVAVHAVNAAGLFGDQNELSFTFDRSTRKPVMRIVNRETREVIQQIPAEYVLRMAEELRRG
jgi:hypothetical protein